MIERKESESGIAILIVLVSVLITLVILRSVMLNSKTSEDEREKVSRMIQQTNGFRFVHQAIADDQLCKYTTFIEGINVGALSFTDAPTADILVKEKLGYEKYQEITNSELRTWPGSVESPAAEDLKNKDFMAYNGGGAPFRVTGKGRDVGVAYFQPKEKKPPTANNVTRIPLQLHDMIEVNGRTYINDSSSLDTFIEFHGSDHTNIKACYKAVSSRSLCLDAGGTFNEALPSSKKCSK